MNEPGYKELYKIKTIRSPLYTSHVIIPENDIPEFEEVIISTSSFTLEELKKMFHFSWGTMVFQVFGILDSVSKYYNKTHGIKFMKIIEDYAYIENLSTEINNTNDIDEIINNYFTKNGVKNIIIF